VCGKKLRAFRTRRDWEGRYMHKSCWYRQAKEKELQWSLEQVAADIQRELVVF